MKCINAATSNNYSTQVQYLTYIFKTRLLNFIVHPSNNLHRGERRNPKKKGKDVSIIESKVVRINEYTLNENTLTQLLLITIQLRFNI